MKKRITYLLILFVTVFVAAFCSYKYAASNSTLAGYEAGLTQGIEIGQLYSTVLLHVYNGLISTDELEEIDALRDQYYSNPTVDNAAEWNNKMTEIVNSK